MYANGIIHKHESRLEMLMKDKRSSFLPEASVINKKVHNIDYRCICYKKNSLLALWENKLESFPAARLYGLF